MRFAEEEMGCGMRRRGRLGLAALGLALVAAAACVFFLINWVVGWTRVGEIWPAGGLWFPWEVRLEVPHFAQGDARWGVERLGRTGATLAEEGCAVACAAMVLAARGADVDPGRLNAFLRGHRRGFTERGWIWWEDAAEYEAELAGRLLPHYEDLPSYALLDWNLLRGNPVIARVRLGDERTHFVVVVGKRGRQYLALDPASGPGVVVLEEAYPVVVEAIRFYRKG